MQIDIRYLRQLSVVVPALDAAKTIKKCLQSIAHQSLHPHQIVVVDDHSQDGTVETARQFSTVLPLSIVQHHRNLGLAASINAGLLHVSGDFIMILHSDCELMGNDWLQRALSLFEDERVAWVTGHYEQVAGNSPRIERIFAALRDQAVHEGKTSRDIDEIPFAEGKCDVIRRNFLDPLGGFPTLTKISGEDQLLSYRCRQLGLKILKDWRLKVIQHYPNQSSLVSFLTNLRKEFVHGKTQFVINTEFFHVVTGDLLSFTHNTKRARHALSKITSTYAEIIALVFWISTRSNWVLLTMCAVVCSRFVYHARRCSASSAQLKLFESALGSVIGVLTDIIYTVGMASGIYVQLLRKLRLLKEPI